jgi:hypothetical protein
MRLRDVLLAVREGLRRPPPGTTHPQRRRFYATLGCLFVVGIGLAGMIGMIVWAVAAHFLAGPP